jgi:hypothetical protein
MDNMIVNHDQNRNRSVNEAGITLMEDLRMLWEQHVVWTRLAIISLVFGLPDGNLVLDRLLQNPMDFEMALIPLYGRDIAAEFSDLLTNHLVIASELVIAAKAGDSNSVRNFEQQWYTNADEIAKFLAVVNPYWDEATWREMLYQHLSLTEQEAVNMLQGNYRRSIQLFDEIEKQALEMADFMATGIILQFPKAFTR